VIEARDLSKSFGPTKAVDGVSLTGIAGSVHAITGENGAGKSTLMKMLAGVEKPDAGSIWVAGREVRFASPRDALVCGVSTVFQELTLLPNLTIAENLYLGREPLAGGLARKTMLTAARGILERIGLDAKPEWLAGGLTVGQQQLLEIGKGISADASVFIFDEPTAALNKAEVDRLATLLLSLRDAGKAIFYISHRLEEIFRFCDTVTVLKDGRHVATVPAASIDAGELVTLMVGRPVGELFPVRGVAETAVALDVRSLVPAPGRPAVAFQLRRGEILGLAGLEGQGQREIIRSLAGVEKPERSDIVKTSREGVAARLDPREGAIAAVKRGIGFVPEDRKTEGLYLNLSIYDNVALGKLKGLSLAAPAPRVGKLVDEIMARMQLRARDARQPVASLSGGNQQKVMLGRWFAAGVDVLLIEQPTRGVDIGAKAEIYRLLREFAKGGGAVLIVSSELIEIAGLCDRIFVARGGRLVAELDGPGATEEALLEHALDAAERPAVA
jgi:ribose transport system ATP-binding protein